MKKLIPITIIFLIVSFTLCSCEPVRRTLDSRTDFTKYLKEAENSIRSEEWQKAMSAVENAQSAWKKIKPVLQLDVDHDYINVIESNFVLLSAYIECKEKPDSLAAILLIQEGWKNIGSM